VQLEYSFLNTEDADTAAIGELALESRLDLDGDPTGMCGSGRRVYTSDRPFSFHHDSLLERRLRDQTLQSRDTLSLGMIDYGDFVNPGSGPALRRRLAH
jgi:hypothetical protein